MSTRLNILLAMACGLILANLYYAQPIISVIGNDLHMDTSSSGLILTLVQLGYCTGVLLLVPLGDMLESRRLISFQVFGAAFALLALSFCHEKLPFLAAIFFVGFFVSVVQIILPYGAAIANARQRGKTLGILASGAILGLVLARPVASLVTSRFTWQTCFTTSSIMMFVLGFVFLRYLPEKQPSSSGLRYSTTLGSMWKILLTTPVLQIRAVLMAFIFSGFTLFWATVPIVLQHELSFSHSDIALLSLLGLAAPVCTVIAGKLADRGFGFRLTSLGIIMATTAFLLTPILGLYTGLFVLSVLLFDSGVHMANMITQQSVIVLDPEARSRLNSLLICITFAGGALGSSLGPWLYSHYGWVSTAEIGGGIMMIAMAIHIFSESFLVRTCSTH